MLRTIMILRMLTVSFRFILIKRAPFSGESPGVKWIDLLNLYHARQVGSLFDGFCGRCVVKPLLYADHRKRVPSSDQRTDPPKRCRFSVRRRRFKNILSKARSKRIRLGREMEVTLSQVEGIGKGKGRPVHKCYERELPIPILCGRLRNASRVPVTFPLVKNDEKS